MTTIGVVIVVRFAAYLMYQINKIFNWLNRKRF